MVAEMAVELVADLAHTSHQVPMVWQSVVELAESAAAWVAVKVADSAAVSAADLAHMSHQVPVVWQSVVGLAQLAAVLAVDSVVA